MSFVAWVFVIGGGLVVLKGAALLIVEFADLRNSSGFTIGLLSLMSGRSVRAVVLGASESSEEAESDDFDAPLNPTNLRLSDSMYLHHRMLDD